MSDATLRRLEHAVKTDPSVWPILATEYGRRGDKAKLNVANARALSFTRGPVEVLDIDVEWHDRYANCPSLKVLLSRVPKEDEFVYTKTKDGLYFAETHGICRFFSYTQPGRGFGGRVFTILLENGEHVDLKGPWSSGSYAMNQYGFGPCMEVSITDDPKVWERGYTFWAGSMLVSAVLSKLEEKGLGLCRMASHTYQPTSKEKYPDCGPYYNKGARSPFDSNFHIVMEEIVTPGG